MKVAILDKKVRRNIALFKHLVTHQAVREKERFYQLADKTYHAFLNCKSGDLWFPDLQEGKRPEGEWKPIEISFRPSQGEGVFCAQSEEKGAFSCNELDPSAYTLFSKTLHILNQICSNPRQEGNPFWVLRQISELDFELTEEEEGKQNLLQSAWYEVDREGAEALLSKEPMGTYLFRKGEFAQVLEVVLNQNFPFPIVCFTLTYNDTEGKVAEKTIIFKDDVWLFYADDPTLSGSSYKTLEKLLKSLSGHLRVAFQHRV